MPVERILRDGIVSKDNTWLSKTILDQHCIYSLKMGGAGHILLELYMVLVYSTSLTIPSPFWHPQGADLCHITSNNLTSPNLIFLFLLTLCTFLNSTFPEPTQSSTHCIWLLHHCFPKVAHTKLINDLLVLNAMDTFQYLHFLWTSCYLNSLFWARMTLGSFSNPPDYLTPTLLTPFFAPYPLNMDVPQHSILGPCFI